VGCNRRNIIANCLHVHQDVIANSRDVREQLPFAFSWTMPGKSSSKGEYMEWELASPQSVSNKDLGVLQNTFDALFEGKLTRHNHEDGLVIDVAVKNI
jgi:hypothetical protein